MTAPTCRPEVGVTNRSPETSAGSGVPAASTGHVGALGVTNAAEIRRLERVKRAVRRLLPSFSRLPDRPVDLRFCVERVTGIEPAWPAWKAGALPLSYTRETVGRNAPLAPTSPADQDPRVAVRVERSAWPIRRAAQARRGWSDVARRDPKSGCCDADAWTDEHPRKR